MMLKTGWRGFPWVLFCGSLTASALLFSVAPSSAQVGDGPLIDTTCNYGQVYAAMRVEAPLAAAFLSENPSAQGRLQEFLSLQVDQRRQRVQQRFDGLDPDLRAGIEEKRNSSQAEEMRATMGRVANTCNSY